MDTELRLRKGVFHWQHGKLKKVQEALERDPVDIETIREHAVSNGGLVSNELRKKAWPKMVGVSIYDVAPYDDTALATHKDRAQVQLDVNRCHRRLPKDMSEKERAEVQEQLVRVIVRLLAKHKGVHYYQGFHDIVVTFLLVVGEDLTFLIMNQLIAHHINDFLDADMTRTKSIISYISPLLALQCPELEEFITRSECAYYFSLSWLITWFGHVVESHDLASRLVDLFLATHPLMPVYLSAALILSRKLEVLSLDCELSSVHGLLSHLPEDLNFEPLIQKSCELFALHPPNVIARKGNLNPSASTLISSYQKFLRKTAKQRPDSVLATLPKTQVLSWTQWSCKLLYIAAPVAGSVFLFAIIVICALRHYGLQSVATSWLYPLNWISSRNTVIHAAPFAGSLLVASATLWAIRYYLSHRS